MTFEALNNAIRRLILLRRDAEPKEQDRINAKLTKLYDLKWTMLGQMNKE